MKLDWGDKYKVGHQPFDNQHLAMVELIWRMTELAEKDGEKNAWLALLDELISLALEHFSEEEAELEKRGYSELLEHQDEHRNLLNELLEIRGRQEKEGSQPSLEVTEFLANWMAVHVGETDGRYRRLFNK
ncbi:MAG: bacteriohemerythrin [Nitrospinota bacterium]|nr:bacteriohemerythrin [Nitrospinota bacterium]